MSDLNVDSQAVQTYVHTLQSVISRMATNSSACKTWCVTVVSAVIVIIADKGKPDYVWISVFPIVLFCFLDAYYLGLEKEFRDLYNCFIAKIHSGKVTIGDN